MCISPCPTLISTVDKIRLSMKEAVSAFFSQKILFKTETKDEGEKKKEKEREVRRFEAST